MHLGGANIALYKLLKFKQDKVQHSVIVLMPEAKLEQYIRKIGINVYNINMTKGKLPKYYQVKLLLKILKKINPDIIQGWMYHGNIAATFGRWFLRNKDIKVFWNIRHSLYEIRKEKKLTRVLIWLHTKFQSNVDCVINNSYISKNQHNKLKIFGNKNIVIPNGFDCEKFYPDDKLRQKFRDDNGIDDNDIVFANIVRYHEMKGHDIFLKAAHEVVKTIPHVHIFLYGRNVDLNNTKLAALINMLKIGERVKLFGETDRVDLILKGIDSLVLASKWGEGFPNIIGEAMATGVPCICTNVGDAKIILGDTGYVVKPGYVDELANAMMRMVKIGNDKRKAFGVSTRRRACSKYNINKVNQRYIGLYTQ